MLHTLEFGMLHAPWRFAPIFALAPGMQRGTASQHNSGIDRPNIYPLGLL